MQPFSMTLVFEHQNYSFSYFKRSVKFTLKNNQLGLHTIGEYVEASGSCFGACFNWFIELKSLDLSDCKAAESLFEKLIVTQPDKFSSLIAQRRYESLTPSLPFISILGSSTSTVSPEDSLRALFGFQFYFLGQYSTASLKELLRQALDIDGTAFAITTGEGEHIVFFYVKQNILFLFDPNIGLMAGSANMENLSDVMDFFICQQTESSIYRPPYYIETIKDPSEPD